MKKNRRNAKSLGEAPGDHDGILDVLANLVGVLTLVGALSAVVAANTAIRIKTPMTRDTDKEFVLLMVGSQGIWNLEPAKEAMAAANRQRIAEMRSCLNYGLFGIIPCIESVSSRIRSAQVGQAKYQISNSQTFLQRTSTPDVAIEGSDADQKLTNLVSQIQKQDKAIFVLLEKEGFAAYRALRSSAGKANVDLGWEPWSTAGAIYFGSSGREMTVQ
jgi:hypothetical protein